MISGAVLNPTSDGFPAQLDIHSASAGYQVLVPAEFPPPTPKPAYASSYSTEGSVASEEAHYENRQIGLKVRVFGTTASEFEDRLNALYKMVGQINSEGGVLKITTPNSTVCYFDLVPEAAATAQLDKLYEVQKTTIVDVQLAARPFWRGTAVDLGSTSETTLPWLVLLETGQAGDVPSLGRLVVTDSSGNDQWTVIVGGQSRFYDSAATAALGYQAEDLTPLGTSTDTAGAAGASGTNVIRNTDLTTTYQAVLKSEIDATNLALTHKGTFRVWARLYRPTANTGAVSVRLEWAEGDYTRVTLNDPVSYAANDREGAFTWANLGIATISPDSTRWEFRLLAKSTVAGDELDADCFVLFPTEVVYTELSGRLRYQNPSTFSARDEFDQTAGNLGGKTLPVGGTWATSGATTDLAVETTGHTLQRSTTSDATDGRLAVAGTATFTNVAVQVDFKTTALAPELGVLVQYTDDDNWVCARLDAANRTVNWTGQLAAAQILAGAEDFVYMPEFAINQWYTIRAVKFASGLLAAWVFPQGQNPGDPRVAFYYSVTATGGTLASGKVGIRDKNDATAATRNYDNFLAFVPTSDVAIFANQSLSLTHENATREDSGGTFSSPVSSGARGRYLKIPPAGPESRSTRLVVKAFRNDPYTLPDPAIDDVSAQLFVTPRGLVVPEA